jgi:hypothetical protein
LIYYAWLVETKRVDSFLPTPKELVNPYCFFRESSHKDHGRIPTSNVPLAYSSTLAANAARHHLLVRPCKLSANLGMELVYDGDAPLKVGDPVAYIFGHIYATEPDAGTMCWACEFEEDGKERHFFLVAHRSCAAAKANDPEYGEPFRQHIRANVEAKQDKTVPIHSQFRLALRVTY